MSDDIMACGCVVQRGGLWIRHCRLHAAAPKMLEALKLAAERLREHWFTSVGSEDYNNDEVIEASHIVEAVIAQVEETRA